MAISDYRIAVNWNVALGSLFNVEDISQFQYQGSGLYPSSTPVNPYPIRKKVMVGRIRGGGTVNHEWTWALLPQVAVKYIYDTYLVGGVASAQVTIYTRRHDYGDFARYNAWIERPDVGYRGVDEFGTEIMSDVRLRFHSLVAL